MYLFTDTDEYVRDFLGTTLPESTSQALKILLSYDDYYKAHNINLTVGIEGNDHRCPFFKCCNLELEKLKRKFVELRLVAFLKFHLPPIKIIVGMGRVF